MNKYLFVVRGFTPDLSASGNLIKPLIDELSKDNIVHVLCTTNKKTEMYLINNIKVFRVNINETKPLLGKVLSFIHRNFFIGYKKADIVSVIKNKIELLDANECYDKIISITYEEILGLVQSKVNVEKKCVFILEKLPEYSRVTFIKLVQKKINLLILKKIVSNVNYSFFLPIVFEVLRKNNLVTNKTVSLEHPMVINNVVKSQNKNDLSKISFNLIYAGGIDKRQRNPEAVLAFLDSINSTLNIAFYSYGNLIDKYKRENKFKALFKDPVSSDELYLKYKDVDFLITIGNKEVDIFPSKLFDCVSTGIPIIHFSQNEKDPYYKYLKDYNFSLILSYEELKHEKSKEKLSCFLKEMKDKRADFNYIESVFSDCTPISNANKMLRFISK